MMTLQTAWRGKTTWAAVWTAVCIALCAAPARAQVPLNAPQLDQLVARIALYPDPLLAQILTASTYSEQIGDAARWADGHSYLTGDALANAIAQDNLPWDPSVLSLLPFPSVLDMMARDIFWTRQLSDAVLGQREDVMDAVQRMRRQASGFGYLRDWPGYRIVAGAGGWIEILPMDPGFCQVPVYDPLVVFAVARRGPALGITFGARIALGAGFAPWGWGRTSIGWANHSLMIDGHAWARSRANHETYTHPYVAPRPPAGPRVERHELRPAGPGRGREGKEGGR